MAVPMRHSLAGSLFLIISRMFGECTPHSFLALHKASRIYKHILTNEVSELVMLHYNCTGTFGEPDRRKVPERYVFWKREKSNSELPELCFCASAPVLLPMPSVDRACPSYDVSRSFYSAFQAV